MSPIDQDRIRLDQTVVRQVDTWVDPAGDHSQVQLSYGGFVYDFASRESRGFATEDAVSSDITPGLESPRLHLELSQSEACAGQRTLEDRVLSAIKTSFNDNSGRSPLSCQKSAIEAIEKDRTGRERTTRSRFKYDQYGNKSSEFMEGEFVDVDRDGVDDLSSDNFELIRSFSFSVASDKFIVSSPYRIEHLTSASMRLALVEFAYDNGPVGTAPVLNDLTSRREWNSTSNAFVVTEYIYGPSGALRSETRPNRAWTKVNLDATLQLLPSSICSPLGCSTTSWDYRFQVANKIVDINNGTTTIAYDSAGRMLRRDLPDGGCFVREYRNWGDPKKQSIWEGICAKAQKDNVVVDGIGILSYFDGLSRVYLQQRSGNYERAFGYVGATRLEARRETWRDIGAPERPSRYTYDELGRPLGVVNPDGTEKRQAYWPWARDMVNENGASTTLEFDANGRVAQITEWYDDGYWRPIETRVERDEFGRPRKITNSLGHETKNTYNSLGWVTQTCDPDQGCTDFTFEPGGQVESSVDARGAENWFLYDPLGRVESHVASLPAGSQSTTKYSYDVDPSTGLPNGSSIGRLTSVEEDSGTSTLSYDVLGRRTAETRCTNGRQGATCRSFKDTFDVAGRLSRRAYPDANGKISSRSEVVNYEYDLAGRLLRVASAADVYIEKTQYNALDQPVSILYGNMVEEAFGYDPSRDWLREKTVRDPNGSTLLSLGYEYDMGGRVSRQGGSDPEPWIVEGLREGRSRA